MLTSAFAAVLFTLEVFLEYYHLYFKIVCLTGASISPYLLCCRAYAVIHYSCMPCALHMRQTQRLQNPGIKLLQSKNNSDITAQRLTWHKNCCNYTIEALKSKNLLKPAIHENKIRSQAKICSKQGRAFVSLKTYLNKS